MGSLIAAYLIAWLGVVVYLVRLSIRQRRLERRLDAIQFRGGPERERETPARSAA